jgi:phosphoribosylamine--glycine ligase
MTETRLRVLVIGAGAREHALGTRLAASERVVEVIVAPGNGGTRRELGWAPLEQAEDPERLVQLARELEVDLVIVGPETPLQAGAADALRGAGILTFGPGARGAGLLASPAEWAAFAGRHGLPVGPSETSEAKVSLHVLTDGRGYLMLPTVERMGLASEGVQGPAVVEESLLETIAERVIEPTLLGLHQEHTEYRGVLCFELHLMTPDDPRIVGVKAGFDEVTTAVLVALLDEDLAALMTDVARGSLARVGAAGMQGHAVSLPLHSDRSGGLLEGLEEAAEVELTYVLHEGTREQPGGGLEAKRGWVCSVTSQGDSPGEARARAEEARGRLRIRENQVHAGP